MSRQYQTLPIPGNEIDAIRDVVQSGTLPEHTPSGSPLANLPYQVQFNNSYRIIVSVTDNDEACGVHIYAELINQHGDVLSEIVAPGADMDQDYQLYDGNDTYELSIVRAANTSLQPAAIERYNPASVRHCPFCGSRELHSKRPETVGTARVEVIMECCSCEATWKDEYIFSRIMPEGWTPPMVNVRRQG